MGKINKLTKQGETVYPVTVTDAVVNPTLKVESSKLIEEVNVSNIFPTDGTDGSNKYTLETAIAKVGEELRHAGLKVTFLNAEGKAETWEYQGGTFTSAESWRKRDAVEVVQGLGDGENAVVSQKAVTDVTGLGTYTKFSTASTYRVGFIVEKDGVLYEFIADHVPGGWNENEVKKFTPDSKYSKVLYHSVYKNKNATTIKVDRAIKELWLSPNIEISDRNNIILGNVSKEATSETGTDLWRIILYDGSKETTTAIESFNSKKKENSLEIIKGSKGSYVLIDWRELPVEAVVASDNPLYKVDAGYVSDIDNFPILKEYIKTENYDEVCTYAKKVYRHSIFDSSVTKEHKDLMETAIKELYLDGIDNIGNITIGSFVRHRQGGNNNRLYLFDENQSDNVPLFEFDTTQDGVCLLKSKTGIGYALIDWSVLETEIDYAGEIVKSGYIVNKSYVNDLGNFQLLANRANEDLKYNKVYYHSLLAKNSGLSDRINSIVKELYIAPDSEGIEFVSDLCLGNIQKGTPYSDTQWRIQLFDTTKENTTTIEIFYSKSNNNGLELIKSEKSSSYIVVDWSEVKDKENVVDVVDPQYNVDADYVTNLDNFPIIKQYLYNKDNDASNKEFKEKTDKVYYHSLTVNDTQNTKIANKIVKELWLSSKVTTENVGLGNIRCNYTGGTSVNYWGVFLYNTDDQETTKAVEVFVSVNKKHALELIKGTNGSYILIDWRETENGRQYFASTSSEYNLNNDYVRDINNFPVIKQYVDLQNFKPQIDNITELFKKHFNTPAISWVDDDFNLTSAPKIKAICDEVGCKCDFALVPQSTGGTNLDYDADYSISSDALELAKQYELEGFHIEMHPPHYGWYTSGSMGGEYAGRKWVENSLVKTMRVFKENGLLNSSCIIYPGSSGGNSEAIDMASCHVEFGVNAGAGNGMNDGVHNKFSLNRLFISLTSSHTKTWYKGIIDEAVSKGVWLILGTHGHEFTDSETVDETTNSLANLKEIIQYANEKCSISPISQIFRIRRPVLDLYK